MEAQCFFLCVAIMSVICPHHTTADVPLHAKDEEEERWVQADECFSKAVERVEMRCKDMTEGMVLRYGSRERIHTCTTWRT